MTRRTGWALGTIVALMAVAVGASVVVDRWTPTIPADAASTVAARTVTTGDVVPDPPADAVPIDRLASPSGVGCLDQVIRPGGTLYLCWSVTRDPNDADKDQDYYSLRMHGTLDGANGTGLRWAVIAARLVGLPSNQVFETWPDHTIDGPCQQVDVTFFGGGPVPPETICGRTQSVVTVADWTQRVSWTCVGCLVAERDARAIALREFIAVPEGTVPTWDLFADIGS